MSAFKTVALVGRYQSAGVAKALITLGEYLHKQGRTVLVEKETAATNGVTGFPVAGYDEIAINLGLPAVVARVDCQVGDELEIDLEAGAVRNLTTNAATPSAPLDPRAIELLEAGGLIPYLKMMYRA